MRFIALLFFVFNIFNILYCQVGDSLFENIDEIVISQNRIHLALKDNTRQIQVISKNQIMGMPATSLPELLQHFSGIDIRRRGINSTQADINIQGGSFEQVLILLNGVRMTDAQTGHHNMYLPISIQNIERIEIVKGSAARIYGQNAYAGIINIITNPGENASIIGTLEYGSFNTIGARIHVDLPTGKMFQSLDLGHETSDGYRYNTDYKIQNIYYQGIINKGTKGETKILAGFTGRKFGANGFYASPLYADQYEEVQTSIVSLATKLLHKNMVITPRVSWRRNQDTYLFIRDNPSYYRNLHIGNTLQADIQLSINNKYGILGMGAELNKQFLVSNNLGNRERTISSIFLDQHLHFAKDSKWKVSFGINTQYISDIKKVKLYPGVDMSYQWTPQIKTFFSANIGNRIPSYTDLYYKSPAEQGNPNLLPESTFDLRLGTQINAQQWSIDASIFRRMSNNTIDWSKDSINQSKWLISNILETNLYGLDVNGSWKMSNNARFSAGYMYLHNDAKSNIGNISRYALDNLKHQIKMGLSIQLPIIPINVAIQYRYNARNTPESFKTYEGFQQHHLLDTKWTYAFKGVNISANMYNITNTAYTETGFVPMPGRWYQVSVQYAWVKK